MSLRLAVKAGSLYEADDQQGSRTSSSTWRSTAARTSSRASSSRTSNRPARGSDRTSTPTRASTRRSTCSTSRPTTPRSWRKGSTALADFAGGLTLDPEQIDKERGVVIEEWRGRLGAGSRIRDKQIPVLFYKSRYAERLPIGKPEILRTAPAARLRAFYDTWYRPERMAIVAVGDIDAAADRSRRSGRRSGRLTARAPAAPPPERTGAAAHASCSSTSPPIRRSRSSSRPARREAAGRAPGPRRRLPPQPRRAAVRATCSTIGSASWRGSPTRSSSAPAAAAAR